MKEHGFPILLCTYVGCVCVPEGGQYLSEDSVINGGGPYHRVRFCPEGGSELKSR